MACPAAGALLFPLLMNMRLRQGVVTATHGQFCHVKDGSLRIVCELRGRHKAGPRANVQPIAAGDTVLYDIQAGGGGSIEKILPRRNCLSRAWPHRPHIEQLIAVNLDQILLVASLIQPDINLGLLDRYLVAAAAEKIPVIIALNKIDIAQDALLCDITRLYQAIGYTVVPLSARKRAGVAALKAMLIGKRTLLVGASGVGKTTLLTCYCRDLDLRIQEVSRKSGEGRHSTTLSTMHTVEEGGEVIDTPGVRGFHPWGVAPGELAAYYTEFSQFRPQCRYRNCTHTREPDCGIVQAVANGYIDARRYHNYLNIMKVLESSTT